MFSQYNKCKVFIFQLIKKTKKTGFFKKTLKIEKIFENFLWGMLDFGI